MSSYLTFCISPEEEGKRIDKIISERYPDLSRNYIQKLIKEENVMLSQTPCKANMKPLKGKEVIICLPEPEMTEILPEDIPLDIVYEDSDVLIVNKPKGMVVHPSNGHLSGTLVNAVMYHCGSELSGINGEIRPGIVHRIDKDTTGLLVVCKNDVAHLSLAEQLKEHSITRKYEAIVCSNIKEESGTVNAPIGRHPVDRKKMSVNTRNGREAVTHYRVLERLKQGAYTHIECQLETGRTHQIRVHMAHIHHPLLGDTVYGSLKQPYALQGQCLHARTLGFIHPTTNQYIEFNSELPAYFENLLRKLRNS
ncbi:MAG: RluA family pseudouridine synthase [Lachnospiraceae bacterium]